MAQSQKENKLLALAKAGSSLVSSISTYPSSIPSTDVVEGLMSTVAVTSTLLLALNSTLDQYFVAASPPCISPLCEDIGAGFEELKSKVDEAKENKSGSIEKSLGWKPLLVGVDVLGGEEEVGKLRVRLEEGKRKVRVIIDGARLKGLHGLGEQERTAQQKVELQELESRLPVIVENLLSVQKDFEGRFNGGSGEIDKAATDVSLTKKEDSEVPDLSEDVEDLKKIYTKSSGDTAASSISSVTVMDDSIEEAWILRRNAPKKTLKTSTNFFGLKVSTYTHEGVSYHVIPLRTSASDIKDMIASARGQLTESEHQKGLKKLVLALDNKAQREIQRLVESRDNACSNDNVKRNWEVVAFQARPRRKIFAPTEKKWWKKGERPLVEWVMVLHGETVDHQKSVMPVKHGDPWKVKENIKAATEKDDVPNPTKSTTMTAAEAQEKMDGVLSELFKPAATLIVNGKDDE